MRKIFGNKVYDTDTSKHIITIGNMVEDGLINFDFIKRCAGIGSGKQVQIVVDKLTGYNDVSCNCGDVISI